MLEEMQRLFRTFTGDSSLVLHPGTVLLADLGLNSFDLVQLIGQVEEEFGIEISDRALVGLRTVQDVLDHLEEGQG